MRRKATNKSSKTLSLTLSKKPKFKEASTQTYRYVEYMPPPIILDVKSEPDSDENGYSDALDEQEIVLESLKIEISENIMMDDTLPPPVEEFIFDEKLNQTFVDPMIQLPNPVESTPVQRKKSTKKTNGQEKVKTNGTKSKKLKKGKEKDKEKEKEPTRKRPKVTEENVDCQLCSFTCKRPSHLKRHMLMHTGEKPHKCEHCEKQFAQKTDLNRHAISHAAVYDFHCSSCGRGFPDDESTKKHEKRCNTKRYVCDICSYMTFSIGNLNLHKRKHTGERPFACQSCDKRFTRVAHLNQHVKLHANDFEMHCSMCGRGFSEEQELLKHEIKCKNRMFQCHICRDVHHRMDNLRRHMKITHLGEKETLCEFCSKQFPDKSSLTKHIKFKHSERM